MSTALGDRVAFERLYQMTSARLFATVRRSIWVRSEAEEVLQEIYLKIWGGATAYDPARSQALTWMMRVARNHAIDHLRRGAARRAHEHSSGVYRARESVQGETDAEPAAVDDSPRPDEWLENEQNQRRFDQLLAGLGAMQRQVLVMAFRDGCTHADIALRLDAPLGSVKSWMRRALQKLKSTIESEQASQSARHS